MSPEEQKLEPIAEAILLELRAEVGRGARPGYKDLRDSEVHALSSAISAKRSADALERIAEAAEATVEAMNVNGEWSIPAALVRIAQALRK